VLQEVVSGEASTVSAGSSGTAVRAQIRLPSGAKGVEKFGTAEDVQRLVQAVAKLVSDLCLYTFSIRKARMEVFRCNYRNHAKVFLFAYIKMLTYFSWFLPTGSRCGRK
jgi:hypothetical protein